MEREVSRKRLFIAFFLYNGIVDYWLFTCPPVQAGVMDICNLEFRLKSLNFIDHCPAQAEVCHDNVHVRLVI